MALDLDDEILQDFLVEGGEILEQLGEQLVELEQSPEDNDLLNTVFRGFHTIKGGAGFLALNALVDICHCSEDIFNLLRQGERQVDSNLMDAILKSLDVINEMFVGIQAGQEPEPADQALIAELNSIIQQPQEVATVEAAEAAETVVESASAEGIGDQADEAFEALMDDLSTEAEAAEVKAVQTDVTPSDDITDDEFEALLDELHGPGAHGALSDEVAVDAPVPVASAGTSSNDKAEQSVPSDEITAEEFEKLLDNIHGQGKHTNAPQVKAAAVVEKLVKDESAKEDLKAPVVEKSPPQKVAPAADSSGSAASPPPTQKKVQMPKSPPAEATVRVDTKRLDDIMNQVGELVLVRNRLRNLEAKFANDEITKAIGSLDIVTADLQTSVMKTRMQPIKKVFGRFPRVVRDLARSLEKEVDLKLVGEETDLDKNLVEALADPLVHLVRNAVDHGVEGPDAREAKGKPRVGSIELSAAQEGDHILLAIKDDGAGMDANVLRRKVVEKGLMDEDAASRLNDKECYDLIFMPGFSTKAEISDVSGRGVGMDVVKTRITQLNGSLEINSELGKGSEIVIKVPLTLAIMPTLMVMLKNQSFALPLVNVSEIFDLDLSKTNTVDGQLVVMVRDKALPLFYLRNWLITDSCVGDEESYENSFVVVVNIGARHVGFVVDQLVGQEEVVIKPLGALLHGIKGLSGATITGNGGIALILDVPGLMENYSLAG
ncbi:MAG: chemotaxis protein CheA [Gammaproteobacteria bacterium]|nr:chemotaxis protein CheA [Gammaproteobacteria bacterium]